MAALTCQPIAVEGTASFRPAVRRARLVAGEPAAAVTSAPLPPGTPPCSELAGSYGAFNGLESTHLDLDPACSARVSYWSDGGESWDASAAGSKVAGQLALSKSAHHVYPLRWAAIRWGKATYLVPADRLINFANAVNAGTEPSRVRWFLRRPASGTSRLAGQPNLSEPYAALLLRSPLRGEVTAIVREEKTEDRVEGDCTRRVTVETAIVRLSIGGNQGLEPGMYVYVANPRRPNVGAALLVRSVEAGQSLAEVQHHYGRLRVGDPVSTLSPTH